MTYREAMDEARRKYVAATLDEAGGCVNKAAQIAGMFSASFYKLMQRAGIEPRRRRGNQAWRELQ